MGHELDLPNGFEGNPFDYYSTLLASFWAPTPPYMFYERILAAIVVMCYIIFASIVYFAITLIDARARGKSLWVYRLVRRSSGRFLVGNQQLLAPVLSATCAIIFLAHLVVEYRYFYTPNTVSITAANFLRIAPWTLVFIHGWVLSWASLQAFVLTRSINRLTANWMNFLFVGVGVTCYIILVTFDIIEIVSSTRACRYLEALAARLIAHSTAYESQPISTADPSDLQTVVESFVVLERYLDDTLHDTWGLLSIFTVTPFLIALINLGSLGLVAVLRRQIDFNLDRQARFDCWTGEDVDCRKEGSVEEKESEESSHVLPQIPADSEIDSEARRRETAIDIEEEAGEEKEELDESRVEDARQEDGRRLSKISFHLPFRPSPEISELPALLYLPPSIGSTHPNPSRKSNVDEKLSSEDKETSTDSSTGGEGKLGRRTRFSICLPGSFRRILERKRESSIRDEAFSRLRDLLRAEQDVIVTGTTILILSLVFAVLAIWVRYGHDPKNATWIGFEISVFLGTYLYGIVVAFSLTINCFTAYRHLASTTRNPRRQSQPPLIPSARKPSAPAPSLCSQIRSTEEGDDVLESPRRIEGLGLDGVFHRRNSTKVENGETELQLE